MHDDTSAPTDDTSVDVPPETTPLFGGRTPATPRDPDATTTIPAVGGARTGVRDHARPDADRRDTDTLPAQPGPERQVGSEDPGSGREPGPRTWPRWWWVAAIPLVLLVAAAAWIGWLFSERAGTALPGVVVEGVDAGGMTDELLTAELQNIVTSRRDAPIAVTAGDEEYTFRLGPEGYQADIPATVEEAMAAGRDGPIGSVVSHVQVSLGDPSWEVDLAGVDIDRSVDDFLARIDEDVDLAPTAGSVSIDPETLTVSSDEPRPGAEADTEAIRDELVALLGTGEPAELTVPVETLPPLVDPANVEAVVERATAVLAESYVLSAEGESLTIDPSQVAPLLSVERVEDRYELAIDEAGVVEMLDGRGERFAVSPRSASYEVVSGYRTFDDKGSATFDPSPAEVRVIDGRAGRRFNPEVAGAVLVQLFEAGEHAGEFELDVVPPEFNNADAREARPDALLGTFTTYHEPGGNRVANIHLLADLIDGEVLPPGDDFSVNRDIGDRTEEKGFLPAGTIIDGEIEDSTGGGVSQVATTFYNAAFFAGIPIESWKPHSLPISRYPLAREATFSYAAGFDIHIFNNTQGALVVKTSYTSGSITVSIFGQDDGREVSAVMGEPYDYRDFGVQRRTTDDLPEGQTRTVQTGAEGFTVDYQRVIEGGTNPGTENYSWTYTPQPTIIETGTG